MFGRRQYLVNSRDRATGTATNFLYRLPNQMRDVVHVNLLHCIVENGVFNVDDTNNKFMLNQQSNNLTDELGNPITYSDFPYLANQVLAYSYLGGAPTFYGVGKGGGALLWCEPTLQTETAISLDWAIKQPLNTGPAWNNNIGNATELMCIASDQKKGNNEGTTIVVGGNNLVSQGHQTNFAISTNAGAGGIGSEFDTSIAVGGPSKSVNGIAYNRDDNLWICTGDDSLSTTLERIKIDDTNNQMRINVIDPLMDKIFLSGGAVVEVTAVVNNILIAQNSYMAQGFYTKTDFADSLQARIGECLGRFVMEGFPTPIASVSCSFDSNNYLTITASGTFTGDNGFTNGFVAIRGPALEVLGLNYAIANGIGIKSTSFPSTGVGSLDLVAVTWNVDSGSAGITGYPNFIPQIQLGVPEFNFNITIPPKIYNNADDFASDIGSLISTGLNSSSLLKGYNPSIQSFYDSGSDSFTFRDLSSPSYLIYSFNQYAENNTPPQFALGKILGLQEGVLHTITTTLLPAPYPVGYNLAVPYSTWSSTDGIEWTPIRDANLINIVGHCVAIVHNPNEGPAIIIGTDDGVVYNDGTNLTNSWTKLGSSTQLSATNFGKVYAVESVVDGNDGIVVAIGCLGGQVYFNDNFWGNVQPPVPTLLTTLLRSPNDYDPVCNSIKYTGNTDGNNPTWIFAGSSMSYITAVDNFLTSKTINIVQFNSGPSQNPSGYPYLEYINGIETFTVDDGSPVGYTCLVGDNMGQYSCSDITGSQTLDSWTGVQPFANNILIQIPTGYYTNTSLASAVAELLNNQAISGNGTFYTEVQADGTFVIANTTSGNWGIRFMNGTLTYEGTAALLGFGSVSKQYEPSVLQGQEGPYTVKSDVEGGISLTPFEYVLVQSDKFGNDLMSNSGLSCWWLVPNVANGVNANSIVYENTRNPTLEYLQNPRDIEQFDIRILNSNGEIIELQDNKNVVIVIEFYTKKAGCR